MKYFLCFFFCLFTTILLQGQCGIFETGLCYDNDDPAGDFLLEYCPESSELLQINIVQLELHSNDNLIVYEGTGTTGVVLATFEGSGGVTAFANETVSSTTPGACLTLDFVSNTSVSCIDGTTAFGTVIEIAPMTISAECYCTIAPFFTTNQNYLCGNEETEVVFDASGTSPATEPLTYNWDFGDGTTATGLNAVTSHTYAADANLNGFTQVTLTVSDPLGCETSFTESIFFAGEPTGLGNLEESISVCPGADVSYASFLQGLSSDGIPFLTIEQAVSNESYFICMNLEVDNAFVNETLSCPEEMEVTLDISHQWVGDLGMWLICPDGTIVTLHAPNTPNGEVSIDEFYSCQPTTTIPTSVGDILAENGNLQGDYTFYSSLTGNGESLEDAISSIGNSNIPQGDYESTENLANFLGCPINGTWTLVVQDFWPCGQFGDLPPCETGTDGFPASLDSWTLQFGECELSIPSNAEESLLVESNGQVYTLSETEILSVPAPLAPGLYENTLTYTNEFGCEYSTVQNIEVLDFSDPLCFSSSSASLELEIAVFLEGAYSNGTLEANASLYMPIQQPYNAAPYFYSGDESLGIPVANIIDWVLVEIRTGTPNLTTQNTSVLVSKTAFLTTSGEIVNANDGLPLKFENLPLGIEFYVCIRHRNHLDILSAESFMIDAPDTNISIDFTSDVNSAFGPSQLKEVEAGIYAMHSGDFNGDGVIQVSDYDLWFDNPAIVGAYLSVDANLDAVVQTTDYDLWFDNKAKVGTPEIQLD